MSSSFFGFNIGVRALTTSQRALEVIGHNIANINTPGHSRQEAVVRTTQPEGTPAINRGITPGQVGSGVQVAEIRRLHDAYIERQLNQEYHNMGKWETSLTVFEQVEGIFAEPTEHGLRAMMDAYWNSWQALESSPEDYSVRKNLAENAKSLTNHMKSIYGKLQSYRKELDLEVATKVAAVNNYTHQIKELNHLIKSVSISGDNPNDLLDRRDALIGELSKIIQVDMRSNQHNMVDIFLGGTALVRGEASFDLEAALSPETGFNQVRWAGSEREAQITNGQLYALVNFRDDYIQETLDTLDQMAAAFIEQTNALHREGYGLDGESTGYDFFTGSGVADIDVVSEVYHNIQLIAAAGMPQAPGDNAAAQSILALRGQKLMEEGSTTIDEYYNNMMVKMGIEFQQCMREHENSNLLINKIDMRRESVSGISLDQELVNMVKFQHSYNAAARIINTMDQLFETIIRDMGR